MMKYILILLLFVSGSVFAQYPGPYYPQGSNYEYRGKIKFNAPTWFLDSALFNGYTRVVTMGSSDSSRAAASTAFVKNQTSASTWKLFGNYTPIDPTQYRLGFLDSTPLIIINNGDTSLVVPAAGVNRASSARHKFLTIDTLNKSIYYTDGGAGGAIDTSNKWVNAIYRKAGKDSIFFNIGGTEYKIKDSTGGGGGGLNTNFANADLVADADRFHDFDGHSLNISTGANSSSSFIQDTVKFQWEVDDPAIAGKSRVVISDSTIVLTSSNGVTSGIIRNSKDSIKLISSDNANNQDALFLSTEYAVYKHDDLGGGSDSSFIVLFPREYGFTDTLATKRYARSGGGGGTDDLEDVTGRDSITTHSMLVRGNNKYIGLESLVAFGGALLTHNETVGGNLYLAKPSGASSTIDVTALTGNRTHSLPDASGTFILSADTSVFSRKQMPAYSIRANNTNAAADATNFTYKSFTNLTYAGTVTWTFSGSAPSGTPVVRYSWSQIGKDVTVSFTCYYPTAGTSVTAATFTLPTDMPLPLEPTGTGATDDVLYAGTGFITTNYATEPTIAGRAFLKVNTGDTGYEFKVVSSSVSARYAPFTLQYKAL